MKRFIRIMCIITAMVILLAVPASAVSTSPRSNAYIAAYDTYFARTSSMYQFQIWFEVTGTDIMDEVGVSEIVIQHWNSQINDWVTLKTCLPSEYPNMIAKNTSGHDSCITYTAPPGYRYRAIVTIYAKKGNGSGAVYDYPEFYF